MLKQGSLKRVRVPVPFGYKIALGMALLITLGMSLLGWLVLTNQTSLMRNRTAEFGRTVVQQFADSARDPVMADDALGLDVLIKNLADIESIVGAAVYSNSGEPLAASGALPPSNAVLSLYSGTGPKSGHRTIDWQWFKQSADPEQVVSFVYPIKFQKVVAGHAQVTFTRTFMIQSLRTARRDIIGATMVMILLAIGLAFFISHKLSRPIGLLIEGSNAIGRGDFNYRIDEHRHDEIGYLIESFNEMARGLMQKAQVEKVFSRFVSHGVATQILENLDQVELGGKRVQGSVMFADIVGFTKLAEKLPPEEVAVLLNEYFSHITLISKLYRGTIDKFIGDCAMVIFGIPEADEQHSFRAIACAVMLQRMVAELNEVRAEEGKYPINFRIGINAGDMLAGNLGSRERMQYTVVGDAVNIASRLASVAGGGEILITEEMYADTQVNSRVIAHRHDALLIRGKQQPVHSYLVEDVTKSYRAAMETQLSKLLAESSAA
jgi:adenylate cyclase